MYQVHRRWDILCYMQIWVTPAPSAAAPAAHQQHQHSIPSKPELTTIDAWGEVTNEMRYGGGITMNVNALFETMLAQSRAKSDSLGGLYDKQKSK